MSSTFAIAMTYKSEGAVLSLSYMYICALAMHA